MLSERIFVLSPAPSDWSVTLGQGESAKMDDSLTVSLIIPDPDGRIKHGSARYDLSSIDQRMVAPARASCPRRGFVSVALAIQVDLESFCDRCLKIMLGTASSILFLLYDTKTLCRSP